VTSGYDIVNEDHYPVDGDGHGTHVSGTIRQNTNNGIGVAGLASGSCIMPVKVLNDSGSGSFADIADGIYYAVDNGAKVINMSLGSNSRFRITSDPIMDPALDYAYENGVTVVCASGNEGNRKNVAYPAIYPTTIAVGATDYANNVTAYSNKGIGLSLVAPGGDINADLNGDGYGDGVLQETRIDGSWGYWFFQGTSMASPHVAAIAAMLYSIDDEITPDGVFDAITLTSLDLGEPGYDSVSGWGLVQAADALDFILSGGGDTCIDNDKDGYCSNLEPLDCDDDNAKVYPGANDTKGKAGKDRIDNDCDGIPDS
jgi:serine protease